MAVRATGFTKFLAASKTGTNNPAQSARTSERWMNREDKGRMSPIIEGGCARRRGGGLEWAQLELFSLQSDAGGGNAAQPALLALPDSAPRQISQRICRAHGKGNTRRAVGMLLSLPYWLYQILRHGKYRSGFVERMGRVPARLSASREGSRAPRVIWVHAVSVGEVLP